MCLGPVSVSKTQRVTLETRAAKKSESAPLRSRSSWNRRNLQKGSASRAPRIATLTFSRTRLSLWFSLTLEDALVSASDHNPLSQVRFDSVVVDSSTHSDSSSSSIHASMTKTPTPTTCRIRSSISRRSERILASSTSRNRIGIKPNRHRIAPTRGCKTTL